MAPAANHTSCAIIVQISEHARLVIHWYANAVYVGHVEFICTDERSQAWVLSRRGAQRVILPQMYFGLALQRRRSPYAGLLLKKRAE